MVLVKNSVPLVPSYAFVLPFEESFHYENGLQWLRDHFYIAYISVFGLYLPFLYFGQIFMRNRRPLTLKSYMIVWNSLLGIFSIIGFVRIFPEMYHVLKNFGYIHSICEPSFKFCKPCSFWMFVFALSKVPELFDTVFLVLRKQKLIFLHVYHHATVVLFAWYGYINDVGTSRWFCGMNYGVHSIMYTYYALKGLPHIVTIPKWCSMIITFLQTTQMVAGAAVIIGAYYEQLTGGNCKTHNLVTIYGLIIYFSYLVLFSRFFYYAYISTDRNKTAIKKKA